MSAFRRTLLLACAALIFCVPIAWADVDHPIMLRLPSAAYVCAIAPEARTVAIGFPEQKVVRVYPKLLTDSSLDGAKEVATNGVAVGLAHRVIKDQGVYLVLSTDDRTIHLLDDKTLEEVGKIALADGTPLGLAVPADETVPFAYYVCRPANSEGAIGRVNLATKKDEGLMETEDVGEIACSADGRIVYGRKPNVGPSGFRAWRIGDPSSPGEAPSANLIASIHADSGTYVADPFNALVASGKELRSIDLTKVITEFAGPVRAFMRTKPVILTATNDGVEAFSYNSYQSVGSVAFSEDAAQQAPPSPPAGSKPVRRTPAPRSRSNNGDVRRLRVGQYSLAYQPFIGVDETHGLLVYAREDKIGVAPISALHLPDEPILNVTVNGATEVEVGQPLKLKIDKIDPKVEVALSSGPDDLKLDGDSIVWTPNAQQIGTYRVSLQCKAAGAQREQEITLVVRRPVVAISFSPEQIVVSQDGKFALATSSSPDTQAPRRRVRAQSRAGGQGESRVALIDLEKRKLIAVRVVPYTIGQAIAVGPDGAYLSSQGANAIYALSIKDLSDTRRVFTNGQLQRLAIIGDALVAYSSNQNSESGATRYHLPDLEPVNEPQSKRSRFAMQDRGLPERVGDGWYMQGVVRDASGKPKLLIKPDSIAEITPNQDQPRRINGRDPFGSSGSAPVARWGAALMGENLMRLTGQTLGQIAGLERTILNDLPVAVGITREESQNDPQSGQRPTQRVSLELHDLISAQTQQTLPLFAEPIPMYDQRAQYKVIAAPGRIIAMAGPRVFVVSAKEIEAKKFPEPVHFELSQDQFILPADHPITLKCSASGGKAPLTFEVANDMPGLKVDAKTGDMTINPAPFLARATDFIQQMMNNNGGFRFGQPTSQPGEIIETFAADARAQFKALTGQDAKGYPLAIPADVSARDDEQQTAVLNRVVLLDVPTDAIAKKMEQQLAQQRQQQEQFRQQREQMQAQMRQQRAATTQNSDDVDLLKRRIAELEKQNTELEAQNKLLKELVGQSKEEKPKQ